MGSTDTISADFLQCLEEPTKESKRFLGKRAVTTAAFAQFIPQPVCILVRTFIFRRRFQLVRWIQRRRRSGSMGRWRLRWTRGRSLAFAEATTHCSCLLHSPLLKMIDRQFWHARTQGGMRKSWRLQPPASNLVARVASACKMRVKARGRRYRGG